MFCPLGAVLNRDAAVEALSQKPPKAPLPRSGFVLRPDQVIPICDVERPVLTEAADRSLGCGRSATRPVPVTQDWIMLPTIRHSFSLMSYVHCGLLILGYASRSSSTMPFKRPRASSHRLDTSSRKLRASRSAPDLQV